MRRRRCLVLQEKLQQLGAEYERRVRVAAEEARLAALHEAAEQRRSLQATVLGGARSCQTQLAEAAAAAEEAGDAAALDRARHAAELARQQERHAAELRRLQVEMSAAPSRAGTRQEARSCHLGAATSAQGQRAHHPPEPPGQQRRHSPAPTPGQLMDLASDEDEGASQAGRQQQWHRQQAGEQPRQTPELLQHLKAAQALL